MTSDTRLIDWHVILDAVAELEAAAWWLWTRAGLFGWPS